MEVFNVHERTFRACAGEVGVLIDSLASGRDRLWPAHLWPRMELDRPLGVGAAGGHGPIRYFVEAYRPGQSIRFRFTGPRGLDGIHGYEIISAPGRGCGLRHTVRMKASGWTRLSWPLVFGPLHDALMEDSLSTAQMSLGEAPAVHAWSFRVKALRWALSAGRAPSQASAGEPPGWRPA
ncbi:MAG: hypothetical protein PVF91_13660 [Chromatiales bacterium]|jgi:hypothetical protein